MSLPFDLGAGAGLFLALAVLVAAFIRGYSGFGFSALIVAATGLVTNPLYAVPVAMLCEIAMTLGQWRGVWHHVDWRRALPMLTAAILAMPLSIWVLAHIGIDLARLVISVFVLVMCALLLTGWTIARPVGRAGNAGVGIVSGLANGAAVGGLPVALMMTAQNIAPSVFRATMIFYLCAIDIAALPLLWWNGLFVIDTLTAFAVTVPIMILGVWLGARHFHATSPQNFRRFAISLLAGLAVMGLAKSVL